MRRFEIACLVAMLLASAGSFLYSREMSSSRASSGAPNRTMPVAPAPQGDVLRLHLASAAFPHAQRQNGYRYAQTDYPADPHYSDSSVSVFVPPGFRPDGPVNMVFFFHGWYSTIDEAQSRFDLYRQFSQSGVQALLVLPELAWNAPDSFGGKLEEKGGFTRMVEELLERLSADGVIRSARAGAIVLAGHSGAFEVIGKILMHGDLAQNIRGVFLFDALYALTGQYCRWIETGAGRFVSVIAADGEVNTDVDALMGALRSDGVAFQVAKDDPAVDAEVLGARVLFLKSSSDHFGVVHDHDEFRRILSMNLR